MYGALDYRALRQETEGSQAAQSWAVRLLGREGSGLCTCRPALFVVFGGS